MSTIIPARGTKSPYSTQSLSLLGSYAQAVNSNTEVVSDSAWEVSIDANTSIIRMRSDELAYMKYDTEATSSDYTSSAIITDANKISIDSNFF